MALGVGVVLAGATAVFWASGVPRNVSGMVAHTVCSGTFVAGRPSSEVRRDDVLAVSRAFGVIGVDVDETRRAVEAHFAGTSRRRAAWLPERGCVLDPPAAAMAPAGEAPRPVALMQPGPMVSAVLQDEGPTTAPFASGTPEPWLETRGSTGGPASSLAPWPEGEALLPPALWPPGLAAARLQGVADRAMDGAGDPGQANARAFAVVHRGRMLIHRHGPGFWPETRLHGWSMGKSVMAMLAYRLAEDQHLDIEAPVVEWLDRGERSPAWRVAWLSDDRARIAVSDLLHMRDGLDIDEGYAPWSSVPKMLFGVDDAAAYAAEAHVEQAPGRRWRYSSLSSNLLARTLRARFEDDASYWRYPVRALFGPIGARTALFETDADGTWIASSYLWASSGDWARLGLLLLDDGRWGGQRLLPAGILARLSEPSGPRGDARAYGAHVWRLGDPVAGACRQMGVPDDTIAMTGHWGQLVAVVPSREAVIVRLGGAASRGEHDACELIASTLEALPTAPTTPLHAVVDRPVVAHATPRERGPGGVGPVSGPTPGPVHGTVPGAVRSAHQTRSNTAAMP